MPVVHPLGRRGVLAFAALGMAALLGCGRSDEIRSYDVKRDAAEPPAGGADKFRLLGVIIPTGQESWFVRFSGPIEQVTPHEKAFDEFVASIRVPADGKPPTYTPPPGWNEAPARQMRVATFIPPGEGKQPELYVSTPFGGTLLMNVNRWRGDAGLGNVTEAELPKVTTEVMLGSTKAYKVDFKGPGGKKKMPPFAGGS
jgi:hypothetical protein